MDQPILNTRSHKLYSLYWKKEKGTSMWNALVLWVFVFFNASNFVMETEDNTMQR